MIKKILFPTLGALICLNSNIYAISHPLENVVVMIDPGHGKPDPGTTAYDDTTYEKDLNLERALELEEKLNKFGATTELTREGNDRIETEYKEDLRARLKKTNDLLGNKEYDNKTIIFVSIHHNATNMHNRQGAETYYWSAPYAHSQNLAEKTNGELVKLGFKDRGAKARDYAVLKKLDDRIHGILTEICFIDNKDDWVKYNSLKEDKLANALLIGILRHLDLIKSVTIEAESENNELTDCKIEDKWVKITDEEVNTSVEFFDDFVEDKLDSYTIGYSASLGLPLLQHKIENSFLKIQVNEPMGSLYWQHYNLTYKEPIVNFPVTMEVKLHSNYSPTVNTRGILGHNWIGFKYPNRRWAVAIRWTSGPSHNWNSVYIMWRNNENDQWGQYKYLGEVEHYVGLESVFTLTYSTSNSVFYKLNFSNGEGFEGEIKDVDCEKLYCSKEGAFHEGCSGARGQWKATCWLDYFSVKKFVKEVPSFGNIETSWIEFAEVYKYIGLIGTSLIPSDPGTQTISYEYTTNGANWYAVAEDFNMMDIDAATEKIKFRIALARVNPGDESPSLDKIKIEYVNCDGNVLLSANPSGTGGRSIQSLTSSPLPGIGEDVKFELGEVYTYPNPARMKNPKIHIETTEKADTANIKIYDIAGSPVHQVTLNYPPSLIGGKYIYEYSWDTSSVASGVYIYAVKVSKEGERDINSVKQLALIK
ncbi:MAG: N-acetylmuramoyl-L-alanine amidase [Elusimicrobia bacterium]|nr:N-acetylmuramoyl-L-alanine amidase [Elusimicrobiota bacterium]